MDFGLSEGFATYSAQRDELDMQGMVPLSRCLCWVLYLCTDLIEF